MKYDILNRFTGDMQFTAQVDCAEGAPRSITVGLAVKWGIEHHANLAEAYLAEAHLAEADLARADLAGANLAEAYLAGADLAEANLAGANLAGAYLARADLDEAYLAGAYLAGANLAGAKDIDDRIIDGGLRSDGYRFLLTRTEPGEWRVKAGCRDYTLTDAQAHWGSPDYRDRALGDEALLIIEHMQRIAEHRAWPTAEEAAA